MARWILLRTASWVYVEMGGPADDDDGSEIDQVEDMFSGFGRGEESGGKTPNY